MSTSASIQHVQQRHSIIRRVPAARVSFRFPQSFRGRDGRGVIIRRGLWNWGTLLPIWCPNADCLCGNWNCSSWNLKAGFRVSWSACMNYCTKRERVGFLCSRKRVCPKKPWRFSFSEHIWQKGGLEGHGKTPSTCYHTVVNISGSQRSWTLFFVNIN